MLLRLSPKDGPGVYPIVETITAGMVPKVKIVPGTCARITTGSQMPEGADAVVMVRPLCLAIAGFEVKKLSCLRLNTHFYSVNVMLVVEN